MKNDTVLTFWKDSEGNKLVEVKVKGQQGFSIKTDHNLPILHNMDQTRLDNPFDSAVANLEITLYVSKFGTTQQKNAWHGRIKS